MLLTALYFRQRKTRDATAVDAGWAFSIVGICALDGILGPGCVSQRVLITSLCGVENIRIGALVLRRHRGIEDRRYRDLRAKWASQGREQLTFAIFYQAQGMLAALLCIPVVLSVFNHDRISVVQWAGVALWLVSAALEALADLQLARFVRDPANKGHTMTRGLWRYSRHPNYFFQTLTWLAYGLIAVAAPWGWIGFSSYVLILYFVLFVTGVPAAEAQSLRTRGEEFRRYQQETSAFIPRFPLRRR